MSIPVFVPGDRGGEATQDVVSLLAAVGALPSIESFGCDNPVLVGLPLLTGFPVPVPEPASQYSVACDVHDGAVAALAVVKVLEDATAACKAALLGQLMGAVQVERVAVDLNPWQVGVARSSAVAEAAQSLGIPERTAAALTHHALEVLGRPEVLAALGAGVLSWRHACTIVDEISTLEETSTVTASDVVVFEGRLLLLAVGTTAVRFAGKARREREGMFPESVETRTKQAFASRRLSMDPGRDGMSWVVLHIPTLAAEAIMVHCHRVASAIKSDAAGRQRAADAAGTREDCREYRTREQIRADVAAVLLMGQELPANSYTNPTTNHHSNNSSSNSNSSGSRGYGGTGGYDGQGNGNSSYNGQGAGNGGSTGTGNGAGNDFTSAGSRGGQGAGRDGRPNNNFSSTPGSGSSGGFTGNGATQGGGTSGSGAAPGGGSTGGTSGSPGSGYSDGPGAGGDGGVPFGEKSAFGVTLFDEEPVWAHSDPAPPHTNTSTSPTTGPETTPAGEAVLPDVDQPIGGTVLPDGAGSEPLSGTVLPDGAGPGRVDGTSLPNTPNHGQDPGHDPGQPSGQVPGQQPARGSGLGGGVGLEDVPLCGELVGDGSGYVDEIVDGVVEDRQQEYLDQLEAMRRGKVMVDPPLPRAQILLKVPFLGLVGITDEPAELVGEGVGPVPLGIARKLMAGESTFLRVLTDPVTGQALPLSPQRYTLRDAEKVVLQALAGGCYFLNCSNPVVLTDIDHLQAWEHGGKSTWENLRPACAAHHRLRHFKDDKDRHGNYRRYREPYRNQIRLRGWTPKLTSDGRVGWITPSGKYRAPLYETPQLTQYPKWLKRRLNKVLNPPTSTTAASTAAGSNPDTGPTTPTP